MALFDHLFFSLQRAERKLADCLEQLTLGVEVCMHPVLTKHSRYDCDDNENDAKGSQSDEKSRSNSHAYLTGKHKVTAAVKFIIS